MPLPLAVPLIMAGVSAASGMAMQHKANKDQIKQQQKLQDQQIKGQKELNNFNQELGMKNWRETNYSAQREQMQKAGLNIGMMYGGTQSGGQTMNAGGSVAGAQAEDQGKASREMAGMGVQTAMQMALMEAQKENIEADTDLKKVDAGKKAGIDTTKAESETGLLNVQTENAQIQQEILNYEKAIKAIEANVAEETEDNVIRKVDLEANKLLGETISAMNKSDVDHATRDTTIEQIKQNATEQQLRILAQKAGLQMTSANIEKLAQEITRMKAMTSQGEKEVALKEMQTQFNTSEPAQIKQWTDIITNVINATK